jgi:uncharacterized protein RhaS with RHS repeats
LRPTRGFHLLAADGCPAVPPRGGRRDFRNRAYDQATGAWTQEDPAGIAGGLNLTQFNGNNPVTFSDPFGLWPFGTHNKIIDAALPNVSFLDRTLIKLGSLITDLTTQATEKSYIHSMREAGQNPLAQKAATAAFISDNTSAAEGLQAMGHHAMAMIALGAAIHPIMDATSPAHTDANGNPRIWNPSDLPAHRKAESGMPTAAQQAQMGDKISKLYQRVTNPQ